MTNNEQRYRVRRWCFTLNNPTEEEERSITTILQDVDDKDSPIRYIHYQKEQGNQHTPHLQGYVAFKQKQYFQRVKDILKNNRLHLTACMGTEEQNITYCSKPEGRLQGPFYNGKRLKKGQRLDLEGFRDRMITKQYQTFKDVFESNDYKIAIKYAKMVTSTLPFYQKQRDSSKAPKIKIYYGSTGCGKSHIAHKLHPNAYILPVKEKRDKNTWWNYYQGEDTVLIDDFDWRKYPINYMLKLLDRHKMKVETKGGIVHLNATVFIITTNFAPKKWYTWVKDGVSGCDNQYQPLMRRLKEYGEIYEMTQEKIIKTNLEGEEISSELNVYSMQINL